jgi:hypothetical protein
MTAEQYSTIEVEGETLIQRVELISQLQDQNCIP